MFAGDNANVKIQMPNHMYSVVVDRFGKDNIWIADKSKDTFTVRVKVNVTDTFYGWLVSLGRDIKVLSPEDVVTEYKKLLEDLVASHS